MSFRNRLDDLLAVTARGERTLVMGVLNVTPDSFSDGGSFVDPERALEHALQMVEEGADIIDVGGESTRPGSAYVSAEEELNRVVPAIERIRAVSDVPISVDTYKASVADAAARAGADLLNDISAMERDPAMPDVPVKHGMAVCLMHMRGTPQTMQSDTRYADVVAEVRDYLVDRARVALDAGIPRERIILDPGFGFGKTPAQNLEIVRRLDEIVALGYPVLMGPSRKSTIGKVLGGLPPLERIEGTAAIVALSIARGAALVRVHDVKAMQRVARVADAVTRGYTD